MTKTIPVSIVLNMVVQGQLPQKLGFGVRNFSRLSGHVCETTPHGGGDGLRLGQLLPSVLVGFWHFSFPVSQDCFFLFRRMPSGAECGPLKLLNGHSLSGIHIHIHLYTHTCCICVYTHIQTHGVKNCVVLKKSVIRETGGV